MTTVKVQNYEIDNQLPFTLIAGPCQVESSFHALSVCGKLKEITDKLGINLIYKSSFDKANRSSLEGKRGISLDLALQAFKDVREAYGVPVLTDIHESYQAGEIAKTGVVDVLQIPAFLCRQTDLLIAAGKTGLPINVKKGQFLAPQDMKNVANKITSTGNNNVMLCERGYTHGYNNLVVDMRSLPIMASTGFPVVFDATHSVQQPGGLGNSSGGDRNMVPYLARAAMATGCVAAIFLEVHEDPDNAPSDGPNMLHLNSVESLLKELVEIDGIVKKRKLN
jgi:2-dehydro-3-deoxyphosphooctonate aldolase (KDO 8-P synthase)